jgi:hypothetical protein
VTTSQQHSSYSSATLEPPSCLARESWEESRCCIVFIIVLAISLVSGHLIESRGVSNVVDDEEHRFQKTLQASKNVAKSEKIFQPIINKISEVNKIKEKWKPAQNIIFFSSSASSTDPKERQLTTEIFDFQSSRLVKPSSEIGPKNQNLDIEKNKIQEANFQPSQPGSSYQECLRKIIGCDKERKAGVILKPINYKKKQPAQNIFSFKVPGLQSAYYTRFLPFIFRDFPHLLIL